MISNPKVSVIIPTYNCKTYLPNCIASIDRQQMDNVEIIIVDDGSTDGSRAYLIELQQTRNDLTVLFENKLGPGAARNVAVQVAKGDWLAFLDADDEWSANKLASQLAYMENSQDVVLSFTNYQHIEEQSGRALISCFQYWPEFQHTLQQRSEAKGYSRLRHATATLFKENIVGTSTVVCRRDAYIQVQGFDVNLPSASDWDLWLKLSKLGEVSYTTEVRMNYLMRAGSVSRQLLNRINAMNIISQRHQSDAFSQDKTVRHSINARMNDAYCEYYSQEKRYWKSAWQHTLTFMKFPSIRRFKSLIRASLPIH